MSELEKTINYLAIEFKKNRRFLFLTFLVFAVCYLFKKVPEIGSVLVASYLFALLLEPWISKLERFKISRTSAVLFIILSSVAIILGFMFLVLPNIIEQIANLVDKLPDNLEMLRTRLLDSYRNSQNNSSFLNRAISWSLEKARFETADTTYLTSAMSTLENALIGGYSVALTFINICLLPFFVFYLSRDLNNFHNTMQKFFPEFRNETFNEVALEIVSRIRAFFKGQITVCLILAGLYCFGFTLVDLPSSFGVGVLTGLLNIFPYLGVTFGLLTSTILVFSADFSMLFLGKVYLVFIIVQLLEGNLISPNIISNSVGVHPLVVMISLIIGGQLFGLLGLLVAIPVAATIGVLINRALAATRH